MREDSEAGTRLAQSPVLPSTLYQPPSGRLGRWQCCSSLGEPRNSFRGVPSPARQQLVGHARTTKSVSDELLRRGSQAHSELNLQQQWARNCFPCDKFPDSCTDPESGAGLNNLHGREASWVCWTGKSDPKRTEEVRGAQRSLEKKSILGENIRLTH